MPETTMPLNGKTASQYAQRYLDGCSDEERRVESEIAASVPMVRELGFVPQELFLKVCKWKSRRIDGLVTANRRELVEEATRVALSTRIEEMRTGALRLLRGVDYPVASVFLHWFADVPTPILDRWALLALGIPMPAQYTFEFWSDYVDGWRDAMRRAEAWDARTFDRALWQWGKEHSITEKP